MIIVDLLCNRERRLLFGAVPGWACGASSPYKAAVGGTDFNQYQTWITYWNSTTNTVTKQCAKGYIPETTWNDSCTNAIYQFLTGGSTNTETNCNNSSFKSALNSTGGGGGQSSTWLKPSWQTGTPNDNARDLPEVSLFASNGFLNSYYLVCQSDIYRQWRGLRLRLVLGLRRHLGLLAPWPTSWRSSIRRQALPKAFPALPSIS